MTGYQAFRYELDPNNRQRTHLMKHAGCARFVYNWALGRRIELYRKTGRSTNAVEQHRELTQLKSSQFPWMYEVSKCAPQQALRDLDVAYRRYFASRKTATNRFQRVGFPRFKRKGIARDSFRLTGSISAGPRWVRLPVLGRLRTKEPTAKLHGRILSATVARQANRWYVSLLVEVELARTTYRDGPPVGIDLGIASFAVISDVEQPIVGPRALEAGLRKQRQLARAVSRKKVGSKNQSKAKLALARHHRRVTNIRGDFHHKLSANLTATRAAIVIEKLTIGGMLGNRALARRISDAGWGAFVRQLEYKSRRNGCRLMRAELFFPSSKRCSRCGATRATRDRTSRIYDCAVCGLSIDRDRNAARNLAQLVAVSSTETKTACGEDVRPAVSRQASLKQEPGINRSGCHKSWRTVEPETFQRSVAPVKGLEPKALEPKGLEPKGLEPKGLEPKGLEPTPRVELGTFALPRRRSTT